MPRFLRSRSRFLNGAAYPVQTRSASGCQPEHPCAWSMATSDRWIVVGGGVSGLAVAFFLRQRGLESVIIERDAIPGGRIGTVTLGDRAVDCGGKNIGKKYRLFRQFAASLGTYSF